MTLSAVEGMTCTEITHQVIDTANSADISGMKEDDWILIKLRACLPNNTAYDDFKKDLLKKELTTAELIEMAHIVDFTMREKKGFEGGKSESNIKLVQAGFKPPSCFRCGGPHFKSKCNATNVQCSLCPQEHNKHHMTQQHQQYVDWRASNPLSTEGGSRGARGAKRGAWGAG